MSHLRPIEDSTSSLPADTSHLSMFSDVLPRSVKSKIGKIILLTGAIMFTGCDHTEQTSTNETSHSSSESITTTSVKAKATPIKTISTQETDPIEQMIHLQKEWKIQSIDALKLFKSDPDVAELIRFFEENAFYSIPNGPTMTMTVEQDEKKAIDIAKNPLSFEVVYMPESYASSMPSSAFANGKTIRILTTFRTKEWLALILTHEISHIKDKLVHGENLHNESEYLAGEIKAHLKEMEMLKEWDNDAYASLIKEGIPLYKERNLQGLVALASKYYPLGEGITSHGETNLGSASCIVAIAFEAARQEGKSIMQLQQTYKDVGKFLGS